MLISHSVLQPDAKILWPQTFVVVAIIIIYFSLIPQRESADERVVCPAL